MNDFLYQEMSERIIKGEVDVSFAKEAKSL